MEKLLSIFITSRQFIEIMGGTINIKSELGMGSVFSFYMVPREGESAIAEHHSQSGMW